MMDWDEIRRTGHLMRARYYGTCAACGRYINAGDPIIYAPAALAGYRSKAIHSTERTCIIRDRVD